MDSGANFLRCGVFCNVAIAVPHFSNNNNLFIAKGHNVKTIKTLLFLLTVIGLTACKQVNITAPTSNFVDDEKPTAFTLTFTGGAPTDLKIQLNSTIVTDRFAVTATGATATGDQLADVVYPGRNFFRVTGNKMVKQITFYYDTEGPSIRILDTDHDAKTVTGYVEDKGGIASVSLDGVAISLDAKNGFSVPFADQDVHTFVATDNFGHTSNTDFADRESEFSGISARLNQGGFNFLTSALRQAIEGKNLAASIADNKFVVSDIRIGNACVVPCVSFAIDNFSVSQLNPFTLTVLDNESIRVNLSSKEVDMKLTTTIEIWGILFTLKRDFVTTVSIDQLDVSTYVLLDIDRENANLDLSLSDTQAKVRNLDITILDAGLLGNFFLDIFNGLLNFLVDLFAPLFTGILDVLIMPIASDFIKDIPITLQLVTLDDGEKLNIRALPAFLDSKNNGVTVDLKTKIWAPEPNPAVPGALGSLYVEGSTPTLGHLTPDGKPFDFGASISSNVINQAFLAAHEAGVTTMEIRPEIYPNATQEGIQVYAQGADFGEGAKIGMRIEPASAPYILFMPSTDGAPGKFGWSDVNLYFDLYKPEWGEYRTLFGVTFDLEVPFDINTTDDGYLSIGIEQLPTIHISKTASDGMLLIPPAFINGTLDYFMPEVMPRLAEKLKVVPLPRIYNHTLHMQQFWIAGTGNNNLSLAGNLVPLAATAAATPPTTVVDYSAEDITVQQESVSSTGVVTSSSVKVANGEVTIDVDGINPNPTLGLLEYRYRVDGGGWSIWKYRETIKLSRLLAGVHTVEVCSRSMLLKREQGCPVVQFETIVE